MKIKQFMECAKALPPNVSILIQGDHGIGKSTLVKVLAEHFKVPLIDRRLSQLSEGDMIGLPKVDEGRTRFLPVDWYMNACEEPSLLFLDELNRALEGVMQASFQIILDRELLGNKLHPESRVVAAINKGNLYQVNEIDPALRDRFWVVDLEFDPDQWIEYLQSEERKMNKVVVDYLKVNHGDITATGKENPGARTPSPRSWDRAEAALVRAGLVGDDVDYQSNKTVQEQIFALLSGFVGGEVSSRFVSYLRTLERQLSINDILNDFEKVKQRALDAGMDRWNLLIDKAVDHMKVEALETKQAKNLGRFYNEALPDELKVRFWCAMASNTAPIPQGNLKTMHPYVKDALVAIHAKKVA